MNPLQEIFDAIAAEGFSARVVALGNELKK
jgi:hypothetical protein